MYKEFVPNNRIKRPDWLKIKPAGGKEYKIIKSIIQSKSLHTVCEEAHCPNVNECWANGTATFMILGETCLRACRFCAVNSGVPSLPDKDEPFHVAESIKTMELKHAVITSVTRDDLPDGGAELWVQTINEIKRINPNTTIEVLIPDFNGNIESLDRIIDAKPDILNHNIETVKRLYNLVRPEADYQRSLSLLKRSASKGLRTKSGLMVGLSETNDEVYQVLTDLYEHKVKIVTIGQYLQPSKKHLPVDRFVQPVEFMEFKKKGEAMGFQIVEAAPLVRSSFHAENHV